MICQHILAQQTKSSCNIRQDKPGWSFSSNAVIFQDHRYKCIYRHCIATKRQKAFIWGWKMKFFPIFLHKQGWPLMCAISWQKKTLQRFFTESYREQLLKRCITGTTGFNNVPIEMLVYGIRFYRGSYHEDFWNLGSRVPPTFVLMVFDFFFLQILFAVGITIYSFTFNFGHFLMKAVLKTVIYRKWWYVSKSVEISFRFMSFNNVQSKCKCMDFDEDHVIVVGPVSRAWLLKSW